MKETRIRCYYEVLEVEKKASSEEIRSAYKKKSLQYHPDKNYENQEESAARFKEVLNAYSILSDPDERAWYDSHRDAILRGGDDCNSDGLNLYEYFTNSCFDGFDDSDSGFYTVYCNVFDTLIEEESDYDKQAKVWPRFGNSKCEWNEVQSFYSHWRNFSTFKDFAWKDEYKINEMKDRYSRRMAERINQKVRSSARKEYVQTVQGLANFLYRRDPRVKSQLDKQREEERKRQEELSQRDMDRQIRRSEAIKKIWAEAAEKEAREDAEREANGETMDGSTLELLYEKARLTKDILKGKADPGLMAGFAMLEGDNDSPRHAYNCPACKKQFKDEKQYKEHINSSKHRTKVKQLTSKGIDVTELMGEKKNLDTSDSP
ncbi:unnamed protein product [Phytomonas sp. EM1]|nr:unnamed protein product [Phytomonas sp. EM1]|eukprot:CCW64315.1 unnamed protein product [Phytomonas sp. isolate EM1]